MPHTIEISDELFARMQSLATPLVDTPQSVIARALNALQEAEGGIHSASEGEVQSFNPAAPPSLSHTTPKSMTLDGHRLPRSETYWNTLMIAVIRAAATRVGGAGELLPLLTVNSVAGRKEDNGYKYLPDVGISVQGQDANGAWRQTYELAHRLGMSLEVVFTWQAVDKAAMPNTTGRFSVGGTSAR